MFNTQFATLAGVLCGGYFLHTCALSITRSAKNPEKVTRDLFMGYLLVFISYSLVGALGYIGFIGPYFTDYFVTTTTKCDAG
jgi:hypothetical protein